jgi:hypothetical protein
MNEFVTKNNQQETLYKHTPVGIPWHLGLRLNRPLNFKEKGGRIV